MGKKLGQHGLFGGFLVALCLFGCPLAHFGLSCPGCGLTHAWLCCLHGDWAGAFQAHLLFLPTPGFILLFAHRDKQRLFSPKVANSLLLGFGLLLAGYHVWRSIG